MSLTQFISKTSLGQAIDKGYRAAQMIIDICRG